MFIIAIKGGLGNQLFQYALGNYFKKKYSASIVYDRQPLNFKEKNLTKRVFLLDQLVNGLEYLSLQLHQIFYTQGDSWPLRFYKKIIRSIHSYSYVSETNPFHLDLKKKKTYYLDGYWQSAELAFGVVTELNTLTTPLLKNSLYYDLIRSNDQSVAIHVRRGDYVNNPFINNYHGHCDLNYYLRAMRAIEEKITEPTYFIFSDDLEWAKENIKNKNSIVFVEGHDDNPITDLFLMKSCRHQIIANSSFSCWASYLNTNPDKIVIAPENWTRKEKTNQLPLFDNVWTII